MWERGRLVAFLSRGVLEKIFFGFSAKHHIILSIWTYLGCQKKPMGEKVVVSHLSPTLGVGKRSGFGLMPPHPYRALSDLRWNNTKPLVAKRLNTSE